MAPVQSSKLPFLYKAIINLELPSGFASLTWPHGFVSTQIDVRFSCLRSAINQELAIE